MAQNTRIEVGLGLVITSAGAALGPDDAAAGTRIVGSAVTQLGSQTIALVSDFSDVGDGYNASAMFAEPTIIPPIELTADFSDVGDDYHTSTMFVEVTVQPPILLTGDFSDTGDGYNAPAMIVTPSIDLSLEVDFSEDSTMEADATVSPPILLTGDFSDTGDGYNAPRMFVDVQVFRDLGHLVCAFDDDGSEMIVTEEVDFPPLPVITTFIIMG